MSQLHKPFRDIPMKWKLFHFLKKNRHDKRLSNVGVETIRWFLLWCEDQEDGTNRCAKKQWNSLEKIDNDQFQTSS